MKKISKKIGKFLINIALMFAMLTGAQHAMNLPLGWAGIGYLTIFCVALTVWGLLYHDEGIKTGKKIQRLSDEILNDLNGLDDVENGKDGFIIQAPNEVIHNLVDNDFLMGRVITSRNGKYKYKAVYAITCGTKTEITFTKINN